jgi:putative ABC transport system permease protein
MQTLLRDFRYALRQLRKNPGFTAIAVTALALGIGLSTIFSVFYNGVLYPFPYRDAQRLTVIGVRNMQQGLSLAFMKE